MKKLVLILLLFITFLSYGHTDSTQYVTNSNVEKLVYKYSEKIESAIVALADKLQQPVEHVYKLIIKQQLIEGISSIIVLFIGVFVMIAGIILLSKYYENIGMVSKYYENIGMFFSLMGLVVLVIGIIWFFASGITCLFNPEYAAIKEIINMIK